MSQGSAHEGCLEDFAAIEVVALREGSMIIIYLRAFPADPRGQELIGFVIRRATVVTQVLNMIRAVFMMSMTEHQGLTMLVNHLSVI